MRPDDLKVFAKLKNKAKPSGPGPTTGFIFFVKPQRKRTKRNDLSAALGMTVRLVGSSATDGWLIAERRCWPKVALLERH